MGLALVRVRFLSMTLMVDLWRVYTWFLFYEGSPVARASCPSPPCWWRVPTMGWLVHEHLHVKESYLGWPKPPIAWFPSSKGWWPPVLLLRMDIDTRVHLCNYYFTFALEYPPQGFAPRWCPPWDTIGGSSCKDGLMTHGLFGVTILLPLPCSVHRRDVPLVAALLGLWWRRGRPIGQQLHPGG